MENDQKDAWIMEKAAELFSLRFSDEWALDNYYLEGFFKEYVKAGLPQVMAWLDIVWQKQGQEESYGDADWTFKKLVEEKAGGEQRQVLLYRDHCSCADITSFLIILERNIFSTKLHLRKVWDKGDYKKGNQFVEQPNLRWYKNRNYSLDFKQEWHMMPLGGSYGDGRDAGYILTVEKLNFKGHDWEVKHSPMLHYQYYMMIARSLCSAARQLKKDSEQS